MIQGKAWSARNGRQALSSVDLRNFHLALHGHPNRRDVLRGISDDGEQDQADESLWDMVIVGKLIDRSDD